MRIFHTSLWAALEWNGIDVFAAASLLSHVFQQQITQAEVLLKNAFILCMAVNSH